jgi:hypothetical protein
LCPCEGTPCGAHPLRSPAVRRGGNTALIDAAASNRHEVVKALVDARANVNTKNNGGCAFPACRGGSTVAALSPMRRARPVRQVHSAALCGVPRPHRRRRAATRRRRQPDHQGQRRVRCAAHSMCRPQPATAGHHRPGRCRRTPHQVAQANGKEAEYDAAVAVVQRPQRVLVRHRQTAALCCTRRRECRDVSGSVNTLVTSTA